jgi:hypothetical protein
MKLCTLGPAVTVASLALGAAACSRAEPSGADTSAATTATAAAPGHAPAAQPVAVVPGPVSGDIAPAVRDALAKAAAGQRRLVVYVGAAWCEPCQRFHRAAESGELDATFPGLTMLEFDLDRDGERLAAAGYVSKYIPLFALPTQDGRASGKQVEGGIKGDGAVGFITPRLKHLLSE